MNSAYFFAQRPGHAAEQIAAQIVAAIRTCTSQFGEPESSPVTASIGIAAVSRLQPEEVLSVADNAMYAVKKAGRNGWKLAEEDFVDNELGNPAKRL
jgi:GGDEF domain-containing protein